MGSKLLYPADASKQATQKKTHSCTPSILSDPVIMSQQENYGPTDLGPDGIRSFFSRHRCGGFCKASWTRPKVHGKAVFPMRQGTSMVLPNRQSRAPLTMMGVLEEDSDCDVFGLRRYFSRQARLGRQQHSQPLCPIFRWCHAPLARRHRGLRLALGGQTA
jgi:alpha-kinase family protein